MRAITKSLQNLDSVATTIASITVFAMLGEAVLLFFRHGYAAVSFPYPLDYGEGTVADAVLRLSRFQNIYRIDLSTPPFTAAVYMPLFELVQVPFVWLFGPHFGYGRALSLLSVVAAAACIALIVHALTGDWLAAAVSGLTLLAVPYILHWSPLNRVDSLALGLSLSSLYVIARWPHKRWSLIVAAFLLVAAVYTRQTYGLAAPLAAFGWLLHHRPHRRAFVFIALFGGTGAGLFAILNLLTAGGFFFHTVTANINTLRLDQLLFFANQIQAFMPWLLCYGTLFLFLGWQWQKNLWWLATPYLLGSTVSALAIAKEGAWVNYLYEFSAALCLATGGVLAWSRRYGWLRAGLLLLLAWQCKLLIQLSEMQYARYVFDRVAQRADFERLEQIVHNADDPMLASEAMGLLFLDGRALYIEPDTMSKAATGGVWNQQPFLDTIDRGEFSVILMHMPTRYSHWTPQMLDHIERRYREAERYADTAVYIEKASLPPELAVPRCTTSASFGPLRLVGFDITSAGAPVSAPAPGDRVTVKLYWQTVEKVSSDYTFFVHLQAGDQIVGQADVQPEGGLYPSSRWVIGETVQTKHTFTITPDAPNGPYNLYAGVYYWPTGERLVAEVDGKLTSDGRALLFSCLSEMRP